MESGFEGREVSETQQPALHTREPAFAGRATLGAGSLSAVLNLSLLCSVLNKDGARARGGGVSEGTKTPTSNYPN